MPVIRHMFFHGLYIPFVALLFSLRIAVAQDAAVPAVRVEKGRIDVTFEAAPQRWLVASVRVACQLRNAANAPDRAQRTFPVAAPADWRRVPVPKTWCQVLVDGKPVEFETRPLVDPADARSRVWPSGELAAEWSLKIDEWIRRDVELLVMVNRFRQLSSRQGELSTLSNAFRDRVKKHLVHEGALESAAIHIASGGGCDPVSLSTVKVASDFHQQKWGCDKSHLRLNEGRFPPAACFGDYFGRFEPAL